MQYLTLTREDPEFESYLLGSFSKTERALPVETYAPQTARERVTFRVVPVDQVAIPPWWKIYFLSCRPELLVLTLGPAILAWLNHRASIEQWSPWPSWLALVGIVFLHTAMFLFNDVRDHLTGADRLNRRRGSRVIQNGWVPAYIMRRWARVNLAFAILFGAPALFNAPEKLALVCGLAAAALWIFQKNLGTRYGLCDLAVIGLFGPLLTTGTALASFGRWTWFDVVLGLTLGLTTVWVFQLRQLEEMFRSKPSDFHTLLGFLDFDRARNLCLITGFLLLAVHPLTAVLLRVPIIALVFLPVFSMPLILALARFHKTASPLSGTMIGLSRRALLSHFTLTVWWVGAMGLLWL